MDAEKSFSFLKPIKRQKFEQFQIISKNESIRKNSNSNQKNYSRYETLKCFKLIQTEPVHE